MYINLSPLELLGRSVVRCKTEEHAQMFVDAMWEQYPQKMDGVWNRKNHNNWHHYTRDPDGICYLHRITYEDYGVNYCQSTDYKSAVEDGYTVVEFEELIRESLDLGELEQSDSVCDFFGL